MPNGQSAPWLSGWPGTPATLTGCAPTHRTFDAQPAGHATHVVYRIVDSPRGGRGIHDQFCDHNALSVMARQGRGESATPAAAPPASLKISRRPIFIVKSSLVAV